MHMQCIPCAVATFRSVLPVVSCTPATEMYLVIIVMFPDNGMPDQSGGRQHSGNDQRWDLIGGSSYTELTELSLHAESAIGRLNSVFGAN